MTAALIDRIGSFSKANPLANVDQLKQAPLASVERDDLGIDFTLIHRIHQLSELLADEVK